MHSLSPTRRLRGSDCHSAIRLFVVGTVGVLVACGTDDATEPGGSIGGENTPDASARELPGDGLDRTPDFDVNDRRVLFERPELIDAIDSRSPRPAQPSAPDAGPDAGADASDANGPI